MISGTNRESDSLFVPFMRIRMKNKIKEMFLQGSKSVGTFFELGSSSVVQCLALGGFDYVIIDHEHGPHNPNVTAEYVRAARLHGTVPFVRVQGSNRSDIMKPLDVGAMGLIIPAVKTVEEVRKIVEYGKYRPLGERGLAGASGSDFWMAECAEMGLPNYMQHVNEEVMLIPQCETMECLENLEEIASVPGVDGIFVGPMDLSSAMGIPGQMDHPKFKEALSRIQKVCAEHGKFTIIFAGSVEAAKEGFALGYDSITFGMDAMTLVSACRNAVGAIKGSSVASK